MRLLADLHIAPRTVQFLRQLDHDVAWLFRHLCGGASASRKGSLVIAEGRAEGVLIRPATAFPIEMYAPERQAEFLLSNAVDAKDYVRAKEEVRKMGLDRGRIPHYKPVRS